MYTFDGTKKIIELTLLWEITKALNANLSPQDLTVSLCQIFQLFLKVNHLKIWIFDENTSTIRDFSKNWYIIDNESEKDHIFKLYSKMEEFQGYAFLVNNKIIPFDHREDEAVNTLCKITQKEKEISIVLPVTDRNKVIGLIEINSAELSQEICSMDFIMSLNIAATQISTAIVNMKLREQMQLNIHFHQAMKDIAKIIESQYELNYIVPLIGEMIDKFIPEHLIYIFNKNKDTNFDLLWPASYCQNRIDPMIKKAESSSACVISEDKSIGAFPLTTDGQVTGIIIADGKFNKLTEKEINYLEQLTHQAAITIEKANNYAETLKQATIDALTGLLNRRQFEIRLAQETSIAKRRRVSLCCMMIDIDYFKSINDTYGHVVGDQVLHDLARIIREEIRTYDIAARYGGEEFCILLPDTPLNKAEVIAKRLKTKVENTKFDISSFSLTKVKNISVTISIGISEFNPDYNDHRKLYEEADIALYKAKEEGRNRVILFNR